MTSTRYRTSSRSTSKRGPISEVSGKATKKALEQSLAVAERIRNGEIADEVLRLTYLDMKAKWEAEANRIELEAAHTLPLGDAEPGVGQISLRRSPRNLLLRMG